MNQFKVFFSIILLALAASCENQKEKSSSAEEEKLLYSLGVLSGKEAGQIVLTQEEAQLVLKGFSEGLFNKSPSLQVMDFQKQVLPFYQKRMGELAKKNEKEGERYQQEFLDKEKGTRGLSGILYKIHILGQGPAPDPLGNVIISYQLKLLSGVVVETMENSESLVLNKLPIAIKEGVLRLKEGGKITLIVPASMAFGQQGLPPIIPGGSTVRYEVELLKVIPK